MKLNNKGWSSTEMFLLSGGILLALLVAVFFISRLYGSLDASIEGRQYADLEAQMASAARQYVFSNNISVDNELILNLQTLKNAGYLAEFKDKNGYECSGYVKIIKIDLVNQYYSYITCPDYKTPNYGY